LILESFRLTNKNAVVVGGAGDLGKAILEALLESGANAIVIDIDKRVFTIVEGLQKKGFNVRALQVDITNRDNIRKSVEEVSQLFNGSIDILVNCAGIQRRASSENFSETDWDDVINVNLNATFFFCQYIGRLMLEKGYGKIINIASVISFVGGITIPAYAASKGGVAQLTKTLSNDWAGRGINVNAIAPGYMDTQLNVGLVSDKKRTAEILERIPKNRWGVGDDLKGIAVFLSSSASDYVCGTVIPVDGGYLSR
jgi:2-dehydro-3-deoxy-D-gluconate 5-dehydrogenase